MCKVFRDLSKVQRCQVPIVLTSCVYTVLYVAKYNLLYYCTLHFAETESRRYRNCTGTRLRGIV